MKEPATDLLEARHPAVADQAYDLLDSLALNPATPNTKRRVHALRDLDNQPLLAVSFYAQGHDASAIWSVDETERIVLVLYIGPNDLNL